MSSIRKACSKPKGKAKEAELERIRNNQRRSRARRKDYVAALEDKIHSYENLGSQVVVDTRLQQLVHENGLLKRLLHSMGLGGDFLQAYAKASDAALGLFPDQPGGVGEAQVCECPRALRTWDVLESHQKISPSSSTSGSQAGHSVPSSQPDSGFLAQDGLQVGQGLLQSDAALPLEFLFDVSSLTKNISTQLESGIEPHDAFQPSENVSDNRPDPIPMAVDDTAESSTLCSLAFSLVLKNNRKGYTITDLDLKLRAGYRHGITGFENCRVDNGILLRVLAEIS